MCVCVSLFAENGAAFLVGLWRRENKNNSVECKVLIDILGFREPI